ncbi:APC family permease [Lacticaseibacillus pantheris]|nr:APC family permease [Lacticaseibacillus pantheris]WKF84322.1 APC family permease [Lacticaseibacillus pantheris]
MQDAPMLGQPRQKYMAWPVLGLLVFVTVIGFENILYPFQNQGLSVIFSWIFLLLAYIVPYALISAQIGTTFTQDGGGLATWVRHTSGDTLGYVVSWMYWSSTLPYLIDVSNSVIVTISWLWLGNNTLDKHMSTLWFGIFTFLVILIFIILENVFSRSMEVMSLIGGAAMFLMAVLFVVLAAAGIAKGYHPASNLFDLSAYKPHFSTHYFSTTGLLIFATSGAELGATYIQQVRNPKKEFPKAMWMLAIMTGFLIIFGSLALGVYFDANHLPNDLKMNGSYYAFHYLGQQWGVGNLFMYMFAGTQLVFMLAQLAVLIDAASRVLSADTAARFMPQWLLKKNRQGRPIHSYVFTASLCLFLLLLSSTLPNINTIFNWLLNLNGIVSPYKTCWVFFAFLALRAQSDKFQSGYTFIKNKAGAMVVGGWCLLFTFVCAMMGFMPQEAAWGTHAFNHQLLMNGVSVLVLFGLGFVMPMIARYEAKKHGTVLIH